MTGPWLVRRVAGDARRHAGVWLGLGLAFALAAFGAAGARAWLAARASAGPRASSAPVGRVIAYVADDQSPEAVAELRRVLSKLPGVEEARVVAPAEALERLRGELGPRAAVVDGVGPDLMFTSIEIAARPSSTASALAFRLRRLPGIADVDLVAPDASAVAAAAAPRGLDLGLGAGAALALAVTLGAALARLRRRTRGELDVLATLGLPRAEAARPALLLATSASALGVGLGLGAAFAAGRFALGASLPPPREIVVGAVGLVVVAHALSRGALRVRDVARAG